MPKFRPEWYVTEFDAHTNEAIFRAVLEQPKWYAIRCSRRFAGGVLAEPVLEVPYELIRWLERNRDSCSLSFTVRWRSLPDVPLACWRLRGGGKHHKRKIKLRVAAS